MTDPKLAELLQSFLKGCESIYLKSLPETYPENCIDKFSLQIGRRYAKVLRGGSVHVFIDLNNGDVLKAASWRAPATGARGNLFDNMGGLGRMTPCGAEYNRN